MLLLSSFLRPCTSFSFIFRPHPSALSVSCARSTKTSATCLVHDIDQHQGPWPRPQHPLYANMDTYLKKTQVRAAEIVTCLEDPNTTAILPLPYQARCKIITTALPLAQWLARLLPCFRPFSKMSPGSIPARTNSSPG